VPLLYGGGKVKAYYNEIDPFAAEWLQKLMDAGHIAPGIIDTRSIEDVIPTDLAGFTQCHFFAGIGVWSYALRGAGWPDDRQVWTGSCPCQPFSAAGKGKGFTDERHLWPAFHWLISQCRPAVVFGEQVASKDGLAWLDLVQTDLERTGYACGAADTCAAGFGAPHIRQRLYWVADAESTGPPHRGAGPVQPQPREGGNELYWVADAPCCGRQGKRRKERGQTGAGGESRNEPNRPGGDRWLEQPGSVRWERGKASAPGNEHVGEASERAQGEHGIGVSSSHRVPEHGTGPTNGFWGDADWLFCRDGKWRPVVATHVALVDGTATNMVRMCDEDSNKEEKEVTDAYLRLLRKRTDTKAFSEWRDGSSINAGEKEVLRQTLHGGIYDKGNMQNREPQQGESLSTKEIILRGMRSETESLACSSCQRESIGQQPVQFEDIVSLLSPSLSLAELYGDRRTSRELSILRQAIYEKRPVLYPHQSIQKIWASLSEEEKNSIRMGFDATRWEKLVAFPLEHNAINRVGRLRGYGNAIVAQQAQAFIAAYMEVVLHGDTDINRL
jgi:DNA (cytosine-5)-methyltransferase 1